MSGTGSYPILILNNDSHYTCHYASHYIILMISLYIMYETFRWDVKPRSWLSVVIKNSLIKSRGVTPASWPNLPTGLWSSWPPNHPHTLIDFITLSSPPVSWCVVGVLAHYTPLLCKAIWVPRKALYKCNKLLLLLYSYYCSTVMKNYPACTQYIKIWIN